MTCNPCNFCQNLVDDSDPSVGMYGTACFVDSEFDCEDVHKRPCPDFKPILASEGLECQIF